MPIDAPGTHPNLPRRGALALMFSAIVLCGVLGGAIGYGLVRTSCPSTATVAEQLLEVVPGYHAHTPSCDLKLTGGALAGTVFAAIGAGIVAILMLRAQSEWRSHPAGRSLTGTGPGAPGAGQRPSGQERAIRRNASAYVTPAARPATSAESRRN